MKTGNVSQGSAFLKQSKLVRDEKPSERKTQSTAVRETVDLSTRKSFISPSIPPTYEEVLELLYGTDFAAFKDMEWISQEGRASLMELM